MGMHFLGSSKDDIGRKHTIFVESQEDVDTFDAATHFETAPELVNRDFNRRRIKDMIKSDENDPSPLSSSNEILSVKKLEKESKRNLEQLKKAAEERAESYSELELRKNRLRQLSLAEAHLVTEKLMRCKGKKRKVKDAVDGMPAVYKWRKVRAG